MDGVYGRVVGDFESRPAVVPPEYCFGDHFPAFLPIPCEVDGGARFERRLNLGGISGGKWDEVLVALLSAPYDKVGDVADFCEATNV